MGGHEQALLNTVSQHGAEGLQFAVDFLTCVIAFGRGTRSPAIPHIPLIIPLMRLTLIVQHFTANQKKR